jgi:hypothetical protein
MEYVSDRYELTLAALQDVPSTTSAAGADSSATVATAQVCTTVATLLLHCV